MNASESKSGQIARSASVIAIGNLASRVLGLVRETVIAHIFGASSLVSAFTVASRIPTMLYDMLIGGMLSAAVVPVFSELAVRDRDAFWEAVSVLLTVLSTFTAALVLLLELSASGITHLLGSGYSLEVQQTITRLLRIMLPALIILSTSGIVSGSLYALKRFTFPAFGASVYNLGIVTCALVLSGGLKLGVESLAIGVLLGSLAQLSFMLPALRGGRIRLHIDLRHPALRRMLRLYLPVAAGLVISQIQVAIDTNLTSYTGEQSQAWMRNATTLIQFPHGLVAVAISMAVLPALSQANATANHLAYRHTLSAGIRMVIMLILPAATGLWILGKPIIALLFEHGAFTPYDTTWTTLALRGYTIGLIFAAIDWPLNYAFYARQDTLTPTLVGIWSVIIYLAVALPTLNPLGMLGLVLADSAKHIAHMTTMWILLKRRIGALETKTILRLSVKVALASLAMGLILYLTLQYLPTANKLLRVLIPATLGLSSYLGLCLLLRIEETLTLTRQLRQTLLKR